MSFTPYSACFVVARDALSSLTAILKKGQDSPNAARLPSARIFEDMEPLTFQVYMACNVVNKLVSRTLGTPPAELGGADLKTFDDMHERIALAQELIANADARIVNERAIGTIPLPTESGDTIHVPTHAYITSYNLPNIYFHVITAYNILRKEGVPLGKMDYLNPFDETLSPQK